MKRSNRLVLLVGVFLAVIAFVGVLLLSQQNTSTTPEEATTKIVVIAAEDIPLGTVIEEAMLGTEEVAITAALPGAYEVASAAIGQVARQEVVQGQQITTTVTGQGGGQSTTQIDTPAGYRAMSVVGGLV